MLKVTSNYTFKDHQMAPLYIEAEIAWKLASWLFHEVKVIEWSCDCELWRKGLEISFDFGIWMWANDSKHKFSTIVQRYPAQLTWNSGTQHWGPNIAGLNKLIWLGCAKIASCNNSLMMGPLKPPGRYKCQKV